jgi:stage V sporulation protein D (sporulation-specific penicillin-binding protein)
VKRTKKKIRKTEALINKSQRIRVTVLYVFAIVAFLGLGYRLFDLQVMRYDELSDKAIQRQTRDTTVTAQRGTIYDRQGRLLAMSASVYNVVIDPNKAMLNKEPVEDLAQGLADILGVPAEEILEKALKTDTNSQDLKKFVDADTEALVREFLLKPYKEEVVLEKGIEKIIGGKPQIKAYRYQSVSLQPTVKRFYTSGTLAAHIIGFVNSENKGAYGVEQTYNKELSGQDGKVISLTNGLGDEMLFNDYENYFAAVTGSDLVLTIDRNIQQYMEKYVAQAITRYGVAKGAAAIAVDPRTNEILAMVNYTANGVYDPNSPNDLPESLQIQLDAIKDEAQRNKAIKDAQEEMWKNRLITDGYEPGSVFKIITLAAALEEGVVDENTGFYCSGSYDVPGRPPVTCVTAHGQQTLAEAVAHSCNVSFVKMAQKIGAAKFYEYIRAFGLMERTGTDIGRDESGTWWADSVFCDPKNQSSFAATAFGQTFEITPMQMVTAAAAAIGGGKLYTPHAVLEVLSASGADIKGDSDFLVRQVISERTSQRVRALLEGVVATGSGKQAQVAGYKVGGKTGTAEKTKEQAGKPEGTPKEYIVSFYGFAPTDNPQIAILLLLDTPSANTGVQIYGGTMAAPIVGAMLADILPYMGVEPSYSERQLAALNVTVPRMSGETPDKAKSLAEAEGLIVNIIGNGETVVSQIPKAGEKLMPGSTVIIYTTENEDTQKKVTVPDVRGLTAAKARKKLEEAGLCASTQGGFLPTGSALVTYQSVSPGQTAYRGTIIGVSFGSDASSAVEVVKN